MNVKLISSIAGSFMLARWRQTMVAAIGVLFSIMLFIALLGFMNGLNDMLDSLILNRIPHIRLYNEIKPTSVQPVEREYPKSYNFVSSVKPSGGRVEIYNNSSIIQFLKKDKRVLGITPKLTTQVFYNVGMVDMVGAINGIDVEAENKYYFFGNYVTTGNLFDLNIVPNSIILGKAAAEKMMVEMGDVIQITTPKGERVQLKVVGYFESGLQDVDKVQSYVSISTAQKLLGKTSSYITDIQIKLKDINQAPALAKEYGTLFSVDAVDIQTMNAQFETGSFIRSLISYVVGITLLIVSGFGIYNILNMMIFEKMDSIAILKATGFSGKDVKRIFIFIGLFIGIIGGSLGLLFGYIVSALIDIVPFNTTALPNITTYPVNYSVQYYVVGFIFSVVTTYFAAFFPAKKASKVDPVDIIRGK